MATDGPERHLHPLATAAPAGSAAAGWSLWRWVCLRGAGFAAERVLALAAPETAAALDRVLEREPDLGAARARAIAALEGDRAARADHAERRAIAKLVRRLGAGEAPGAGGATGLAPAAAAALAALTAAARAHEALRGEAEAARAAERPRLCHAVREAARDPRFREAIAWQNRHALRSGVDALLRQPEGATNTKARQYERLVASHLQRYCVKNDTIGFFGPVAWARIGRGPAAFSVRPGPRLLAGRAVYFEHWGVDALAAALARDPRLRPHLAPRRHPAVWLEGTTLHHPIDRATELPPEYARLLEACDGRRSARAIAAQLLAEPGLDWSGGLSGEAAVFELLDELVAQRAAIWTLEVPPHVEHPDRALGALLEAAGDREAAAPGLAALAELRAAGEGVARAAGDAEPLDVAFAHLEGVFSRHTEAAPVRRSGETYAGRTLVYEDCRRDLELELGPAVLERLAAPLSLVLASARWFTFELARRYRAAFTAIHGELARETGAPAVDFLRFWERASAHFTGADRRSPPIAAEVVAELQRRWGKLLGLEGEALEQPHLRAEAARLAPAAAELFAAPGPGWPSARHHSPDVMIAAASADAIARGALTGVLGELHLASATVAAPVSVHQHPRPRELAEVLAWGRGVPIIEAVIAKERAARTDAFSILPGDLDLELGVTRSRRPREQVLAAGALRVEPAGGSLRVTERGGVRTFALEQLLDLCLTNESMARWKPLPPAPRTPRVSIDGLVVHRRSWRFEAAALDFARAAEPLDRLLGARRWARAHELPRFVFYRVPRETKPCYLDLDSPHYVELLAHLAREAPELAVSEMLPAFDGTWLPDAEGARYACEWRFVAVDPEPWRDQG